MSPVTLLEVNSCLYSPLLISFSFISRARGALIAREFGGAWITHLLSVSVLFRTVVAQGKFWRWPFKLVSRWKIFVWKCCNGLSHDKPSLSQMIQITLLIISPYCLASSLWLSAPFRSVDFISISTWGLFFFPSPTLLVFYFVAFIIQVFASSWGKVLQVINPAEKLHKLFLGFEGKH